MTVAMLLLNTVTACEVQTGLSKGGVA